MNAILRNTAYDPAPDEAKILAITTLLDEATLLMERTYLTHSGARAELRDHIQPLGEFSNTIAHITEMVRRPTEPELDLASVAERVHERYETARSRL